CSPLCVSLGGVAPLFRSRRPQTIMKYLTAKELRDKLKDVPDDTPVYYQRIEDHYFDNNGWVYKTMKWGDSESDYIEAFSASLHPDENVFVVNGHY
ncbi:MAG: hypothetical protein ABIH76_06440, partial [Candidatus Bathyarchaeota archaeon]